MTNAANGTRLSASQLLLLVAIALTLLVLSAWGVYTALTSASPVLIWDFHPLWTALHAMLREGADPYGPEVLATIQGQMLGRAALPGEDQCAFSYPLYILVLIGPLTYLPLSVAQAVWLALLEASLLAFILLAPRAVGWRPSTWLLVLTALFTLGLHSAIWAIWLGQISIVIAAFTALAWWGLRTKRWALAGVCLALSTTKPQMVFLFVPGVLLWATYWRHWRLVIAFAVAMGLLILSPMPWQPTWPLDWLDAMQHYGSYSPYVSSLMTLFSSTWLSVGIAALLVAWTAYCWWQAKQLEGAAFDWTLGMLLVITALIAPRTSYVNQLVLLLPLFFVFRQIARPGIIVAIGLVLLVGPWVFDLLLAGDGVESLLWQHRVINPILPVGLTIALLALSPRAARRAGDELA